MSLISYIKRDRNYTFSYWRYRLLHWTFGINPKTPADSNMPRFLYTHYCPLFHLTNILAFISPLTLLVKLIAALIVLLASGIHNILKLLDRYVLVPLSEYMQKRAVEKEKQRIANMSTPEYKALEAKKGKRKEVEYFSQIFNINSDDLDYLERYINSEDRFEYLTKDEAFSVFEKLKAQEKKRREENKRRKEREELRKKEFAERMVFWIRFSQIFVKILTVLVVILGGLLLAGGLYVLIPIMISGLWFLASAIWYVIVSIWGFLTAISVAKVFNGMLMALAFAVVSFLIAFIGVKTFPPVVRKIAGLFSTPIEIAGSASSAFAEGSVEAISGVFEFFSLLYKDNCPAITIEKEEALLEDE